MGREWGFGASLFRGFRRLFVVVIRNCVVFVIFKVIYLVFIRVGDLAVIIAWFFSVALPVAFAFVVIVVFRDDNCELRV